MATRETPIRRVSSAIQAAHPGLTSEDAAMLAVTAGMEYAKVLSDFADALTRVCIDKGHRGSAEAVPPHAAKPCPVCSPQVRSARSAARIITPTSADL